MAIPDKPLEMDIDPDAITLDEAALFSPKGFDFYDFRQFLIDHVVSWTPEEIGKITIGELGELAEMVGEAAQAKAVPLANSPRSKTGRGSRATKPQPGRTNMPMPSSLAATRKMSDEP